MMKNVPINRLTLSHLLKTKKTCSTLSVVCKNFNSLDKGVPFRNINLPLSQNTCRSFASTAIASSQDVLDIVDDDELEVSDLPKEEVKPSIHDYELHPKIIKALEKAGIEDLFPVQKATIDEARRGRDMLVQSKTGSGKTLAFGIPLLETILKRKEEMAQNGEKKRIASPIGVILCPTRELAIQVEREIMKYSHSITSACIYGGVPYRRQLPEIQNRKGLDLLIGTPGRVADIVSSGNLNLNYVKVAVLDEADEMLKMGFANEVDAIYEQMPSAEERQNLLFSATFARGVQNIARKYMNNAKHINLVGKDDSKIPEDIELLSMISNKRYREEQLGNVLSLYCGGKEGARALVFTTTKLRCDRLASSKSVVDSGVLSLPLHGDMSQEARENALNAFRSRRVKCLIATDVAARGLDIPEVDLVIHYELPQQLENFVHRTGRTGRAGRKGVNIVMHDLGESKEVEMIEKHIQRKLNRVAQPRTADIVSSKGDVIIDQILKMTPETVQTYTSIAERLQAHIAAEGINIDPLAASLCLASGFKNSRNFSDLTGEEGQSTLYVTCPDPSYLHLPGRVKNNTVSKFDTFRTKDRMETLISGIAAENGIELSRGRAVRHIEICQNLEGVLVDTTPRLAERLLKLSENMDDSDDTLDNVKFETVKEYIPPILSVQKKRNDHSGGGRNTKWGGRGNNNGNKFGNNKRYNGRRGGNDYHSRGGGRGGNDYNSRGGRSSRNRNY